MSTAIATSKKSAITVSSAGGGSRARGSKEIYVSTRTTRKEDGTFKVEMIEYPTDGSGDAIVIGEREPGNPNKWNWNGNGTASAKELRKSDSSLSQVSKNQLNSSQMRNELVRDSQDQEELNRANAQPNKATTPPETGDNSRPSNKIKADPKTRNSFPADLRYPDDMDRAQDVIKFDMLKYEPKKVSGFGFSERNSDRASIGSVILPIPGGISDANACDWGGDSMNPLQIAGAGIALSMLDNDSVIGDGLSGALGDLKNQVVSNTGAVKGAIGGATAASAIGSDINSLLGRTQGVILNPNLELLFQRPSLRPFSFEFKMSPRSSAEAARIVEIIRFFKQGMAPIRDESRLFLKTPHTFRIKYVQQGEDSKFLNRFKECALLSCNIQYTPEGNYAPYEDGAMSSYAMSLQFKELEPVYNDEYSDFDDTHIGF
jgi:hypothetical protein